MATPPQVGKNVDSWCTRCKLVLAHTIETVLNGITLVGSIVGTRVDLREVFELHAAGLTKVITEVRSLETVNDAIEDVEAGRVPARVVFVP